VRPSHSINCSSSIAVDVNILADKTVLSSCHLVFNTIDLNPLHQCKVRYAKEFRGVSDRR
jgi:hypothetical protein